MRFLTLLLAGIVLAACAHRPQRGMADDAAAVRAVIEQFNRSVATRDRDGYLDLFLPGNIGWQSVMDDFQLARERRRKPQATRAAVDPNNTHLTFIDNAVRNPKVGGAEKPPTFPISVETDGDVASASQDYRFFNEGREVGRGRSIWLLVKTENGWKITAVVYSKRKPGPVGKAASSTSSTSLPRRGAA